MIVNDVEFEDDFVFHEWNDIDMWVTTGDNLKQTISEIRSFCVEIG